MDAENVVVDREHVEGWGSQRRTSEVLELDRNLRVVDSGEVAGTGWLVLFWLERKGVRVDTWHWGTGVVLVRLHLVKVLTGLFLESVLTVEDQLERVNWTDGLSSTITAAIFRKFFSTTIGTDDEKWATGLTWGNRTFARLFRGAIDNNVTGGRVGAEVPQTISGGGAVVNTPDQFLDWVVVGQSDLLGRVGRDRIGASVLHLLDQVFVTLLGESSTLFSVEVDVVGPHLEDGRVQERIEFRSQVKVDSDFVVLQGNQWQGQSWVSVEEKDEWQEDLSSIRSGSRSGGGHFTPVSLGRIGQVQFGVQSPPSLVVLIDSLTTDRQFSVLDRTLSDPRGTSGTACIDTRRGLEFDVHVTDQITVSGDSHGNATGIGGGTVDSLFDVFHREVSVAFVNRLEESDFWVTSQVDILGAIGDELHETTGHF